VEAAFGEDGDGGVEDLLAAQLGELGLEWSARDVWSAKGAEGVWSAKGAEGVWSAKGAEGVWSAKGAKGREKHETRKTKK
jgi:hypothetical protein